jgi:SAM-dependent methyltransferase
MPWYYAVAEARHELQNPTSEEKVRLLGEALALDASSRVLDLACGRGGPALVLAREFGCSILGVERAPEFVAAARERVAAAGLGSRIEIVHEDAAAFDSGTEAWDAALCLGAAFIWAHLGDAAAALRPAVRAGGHVAIGEPYWRRVPLPPGVDDAGWVTFAETVARLEATQLTLTTVLRASDDDWDRYESLRWRTVEDWLAANADDGDAPAIRAQYEHARRAYVEYRRELLGWAIFVGRKLYDATGRP